MTGPYGDDRTVDWDRDFGRDLAVELGDPDPREDDFRERWRAADGSADEAEA